jgi:hypothetical protein
MFIYLEECNQTCDNFLTKCTSFRMYDQYSFQVIPVMGQLIAGQWKPYQYLVESIRQFPNQVRAHNIVIAITVRLSTVTCILIIPSLNGGWDTTVLRPFVGFPHSLQESTENGHFIPYLFLFSNCRLILYSLELRVLLNKLQINKCIHRINVTCKCFM